MRWKKGPRWSVIRDVPALGKLTMLDRNYT